MITLWNQKSRNAGTSCIAVLKERPAFYKFHNLMHSNNTSSQELLGTAALNAAAAADSLKTPVDLSSWKIYTYLYTKSISNYFCFALLH